MKSKGLGDTVEKITTATGIKKLVKWIAGEDCGCDQRKEKLNKLFPYKNPKCLTEEEHIWCKNYFETFRSTINRNDQHKMLDIYNRVFDAKKEASSCGSCVRELYNSVNKLYKTYEE
tara:strand:+ start:730 stop:1080 length:351 start_codon:yes stop_codon:yes gene_type:complete